jgi:hypothetical protein
MALGNCMSKYKRAFIARVAAADLVAGSTGGLCVPFNNLAVLTSCARNNEHSYSYSYSYSCRCQCIDDESTYT